MDSVHLSLLARKCHKAEKCYQVRKSKKSSYQVRMCFADDRGKDHPKRSNIKDISVVYR